MHLGSKLECTFDNFISDVEIRLEQLWGFDGASVGIASYITLVKTALEGTVMVPGNVPAQVF